MLAIRYPLVLETLAGAACVWVLAFSGAHSASPGNTFALGIEYMVPGLARAYAPMGVVWAKSQPAGFGWGEIEPAPPIAGRHRYHWDWPDRLIREYQAAGFRNLQIYLQCRNPWATAKPLPAIGHASQPIHPRYLGDYAAFIRAIVERYDGDGFGDMPGLRYPVRYWEIEAEWGTFWPASAREYINLLQIARDAVHQADPNGKIILQGFLFWSFFDGNPDEAAVQQRLAAAGTKARKTLEDIREILAHPNLFDAIEFHSLSDYTEIAPTARFLRAEMRRYGYQKPIWVGDANASINPMVWWGKANYPYVPSQVPKILEWIGALKDARNPRHSEAVAWFRKEQAAFTTKKVVCAWGEGLAGINIGNLEDWEQLGLVPRITGTAPYCGMMDRPFPRRVTDDRVPGKPRPVYYSLALLQRTLGGATKSEVVDLGEHVVAYRFHVTSSRPHSVVVVWYEDGVGRLPGDPVPEKQLRIPSSANQAELLRLPDGEAVSTATKQLLHSRNGSFEIAVTPQPVLLVEGARHG
ncbi:MAG: hypothetical protein ACP5VE_11830 [Chthonomonadales bacterium]